MNISLHHSMADVAIFEMNQWGWNQTTKTRIFRWALETIKTFSRQFFLLAGSGDRRARVPALA
jgi:hypothetical protein